MYLPGHLSRSRSTMRYTRFRSSMCSRIFDISDPGGRAELELLYWGFTGLCMVAILAIAAYYFVQEEVSERESANLIVLFSCSLSFVLFIAIAQFHLSTSVEVTKVGPLDDDKSMEEEREKRTFYLFSTLSLLFYISFIACAFNQVSAFISILLALLTLSTWQWGYIQFGLFLYRESLVSNSFLIQYIVLGIFIFLSLLGATLALVNFS